MAPGSVKFPPLCPGSIPMIFPASGSAAGLVAGLAGLGPLLACPGTPGMSGVARGLADGPDGGDALPAAPAAAVPAPLQADTARATAASPTAITAGPRPGFRPAPGQPGRSVIGPLLLVRENH